MKLIKNQYSVHNNMGTVFQTVTSTQSPTYQERAQEDKGDKVEICKVTSAFRCGVTGARVTGFVAETGQHDLVPALTSGTPTRRVRTSHIRVRTDLQKVIYEGAKACREVYITLVAKTRRSTIKQRRHTVHK